MHQGAAHGCLDTLQPNTGAWTGTAPAGEDVYQVVTRQAFTMFVADRKR
jgi:hypothetical protein